MTVFGSNTISVVATVSSTRFNIQQCYVLPTQCIYVFCVDLRTNSDYFPMRHKLIGLYNRDGECLLRGTDWSLYIIQVMCFVWIWEQTAIISLYSINRLVCITDTESVYCAVRTGSLYIIQVMCFVWIWEQTVIISAYSINWLVFRRVREIPKSDCWLRHICSSFCLSALNNSAPARWIFMKFKWVFFENLSIKSQFH
jgi:hypothetical protein